MPTRLAALSLPLAALLLAGCATTSAVEHDLSAHLAPESAAGDFKVFAVDDGTQRRLETVRVVPRPEGRYEEEVFRLNGTIFGGGEGIARAGRERVVLVSRAATLSVTWDPPGLVRPLRIPIGRTLKASAKGRAEEQGLRIGSAVMRTAATLVEVGPCETGVASYPDAARFEERTTFRVRDKVRHRKLEVEVEGEACYARGLGLVATTERTRTFVDGALRADTGERRTHLVSGTILGVPIP
jgi:hypothetical protein